MNFPTQIITVSIETLEAMLDSRIEPLHRMVKSSKAVMNAKEAATYLNISTTTLNKEVAAGKLIQSKIGERQLYRIEDLEDYMKSNRVLNITEIQNLNNPMKRK